MLFLLDDIWTKVPIVLRVVESVMEMTREDGSPGQAHTHAYMDMLGLCARERRSELDGMVGGGRREGEELFLAHKNIIRARGWRTGEEAASCRGVNL